MARINIPREVLLVEVERRCRDPRCNWRVRVGLTKEEARAYCGFECEHCGRTWEDVLSERDVPEWWEELTITGLDRLRLREADRPEEPGGVIERMSESYRLGPGGEGTGKE